MAEYIRRQCELCDEVESYRVSNVEKLDEMQLMEDENWTTISLGTWDGLGSHDVYVCEECTDKILVSQATEVRLIQLGIT